MLAPLTDLLYSIKESGVRGVGHSADDFDVTRLYSRGLGQSPYRGDAEFSSNHSDLFSASPSLTKDTKWPLQDHFGDVSQHLCLCGVIASGTNGKFISLFGEAETANG